MSKIRMEQEKDYPVIEKGIKCPFEVPNEAFMVFKIKPGALNNAQGIVNYPEAFSSV